MLAFIIKTLPTVWPFIQELLKGSRDRPNQKRRSGDRRVSPLIWLLLAVIFLGGEHINKLSKELETAKAEIILVNNKLLNQQYETKLCHHDAERLREDIQLGKEVVQNERLECKDKLQILQRKIDEKVVKEHTHPKQNQSERIQRKLDMLERKT